MHNNFKISLLGIALGMSLLHSSHAAPLLAGQDQPIAQAAKIPAANAWLEIDRQAFADNLRTLQKTLQPQTQMCAVMKADAYGAGIDLLMPAILETQTPCVGITSNAEAAIVTALLESGDLRPEELRRAEALQQPGVGVLSMLERLGLLSEQRQAAATARVLQLPLADPANAPELAPETHAVSTRFLRQFQLVPVRLVADGLEVGAAQAHLQGYYGRYGFVAVTEVYLEDDIPHIGMRRAATDLS